MKFQYLILLVTLSLTGCATISKLLEDSPELKSDWDNPGAAGASSSSSSLSSEESNSTLAVSRRPAELPVAQRHALLTVNPLVIVQSSRKFRLRARASIAPDDTRSARASA